MDPLERIERKIDQIGGQVVEMLRCQAAAEARCVATHAGLDQVLREDRARIMALEQRAEAAGLQRAGWVGGWRVLVVVAGALAAGGGLAVGILRLFH